MRNIKIASGKTMQTNIGMNFLFFFRNDIFVFKNVCIVY